jgi:bifunctional DNA-binding transcriptional regulator/antitoxin component of YhaV-PrlF toxin-antitoxin module
LFFKKESNINLFDRDLSMKIEFHTVLGSQGRVYIPKEIVERFELWVETPINVTMLIRNYKKSSFPTKVKKGFMFTVPKRERVFHELRYKEPLKITITKINKDCSFKI